MNDNFSGFGLTRPVIEPVSTVSKANALFSRPLIGLAKLQLFTA